MRMRRGWTLVVCGALVAAAALYRPATAQSFPPYAVTLGDARISGFVAGFDGRYALQVRDDRGYVDRVQLHDGTIVVPAGGRLRIGLPVSIRGSATGDAFLASEIDAIDPREFDETHALTGWQGYDPYGCSNAPAPPVHGGAYASWRYDGRC